MKHKPQNLDNMLRQFTGTENYYRSTPFGGKHTDGVQYLADEYEAHWLLDVVFSHVAEIYNNKNISDYDKALLVCILRLEDNTNGATFIVEDGNENELARQDIPFTDFPALEQTIWVQNGVAMLPSEY